MAVTGLSSTSFVLGYASSTGAAPAVKVGTVSGTTITGFGTPQTTGTGILVGNLALATINGTTDKFAFAYDDDTITGTARAKAVIGSVSGSSITLGSLENMLMATSSNIKLVSNSPNSFLMIGTVTSPNIIMTSASLSGTTITATTTSPVGWFTSYAPLNFSEIDSTHTVVSVNKEFRVIENSGATVSNVMSLQTLQTTSITNFSAIEGFWGIDTTSAIASYTTNDGVGGIANYGTIVTIDPAALYYQGKAIVLKSSGTTIEGTPTLGVGTADPRYTLHVNVNSTGAVAGFTNTNGTCTVNPTSTSFSCTSDQRFKTNISTISSSTDIIRKLRGVNFSWKADETSAIHSGFIAQEVQVIAPELVTENIDGSLSVNYLGFAPYLVNAWNALDVRVASLESIATSTLPATSTPMLSVTDKGLGIGTLNPDFALHAKFEGAGIAVLENQNGICEINPSTGSFGCAPSANVIVATSTIGTSISSSTDIIRKLHGVNLSLMSASTTVNQFGFLADDVELVAPELVANIGGVKLVRTTDLIPLLVNSVNDLALKVDSLDERVAKLEAMASSTSATTTVSTTTVSTGGTTDTNFIMSTVLSALQNMGTSISQGMAHFTSVFADNIVIGSQEKPSGITLYDVVTHLPFCMRIENGGQVTTSGTCADTLHTTAMSTTTDSTVTITDNTASSTSVATDTSTSTSTTSTLSSDTTTATTTTALTDTTSTSTTTASTATTTETTASTATTTETTATAPVDNTVSTATTTPTG